RHISVRVPAELEERLRRRAPGGKSELINRLIDEGLRMDEHPGIIFRPGPAGRRPGLIGGPDVWEVARVLRAIDARGEERIAEAVARTGLDAAQIRAADRYHAAHTHETHAWIDRVDDTASSRR